ncbi:uncharacterized protein LOC120328838 [Styela clava]
MWKVIHFPLLILLFVAFQQPCSSQETGPELANITVIVNGEERTFAVEKQYLPLFSELAKAIVESLNGDLDECKSGVHTCNLTAEHCVNLDGNFHCPCKDGYVRHTTNATCELDLCKQSGTNCTGLKVCNNDAADLRCICRDGHVENGTECVVITSCDANDCPVNSTCVEDGQSYNCICNSGYELETATGSGGMQSSSCEDIDECTVGTHCDNNADCSNTIGSFTCMCQSGYTGNGKNCTDINECASDLTNDCSQSCTNTKGSHTCECYDGFSGDGINCEDINECLNGDANCHATLATCKNTQGSSECHCNEGYSGDGVTCADVNECTTAQDNCNDTLATCGNTEGSFECTCMNGYTGDGVDCQDINECTDDTHDCNMQTEVCVNSPGDFFCECAPNYERHSSGLCAIEGFATTASITTRLSSSSRKRRQTSDIATELEKFLTNLLSVRGLDADVSVQVISETFNNADNSTIYELLISADPQLATFLQEAFTNLEGQTLGGLTIAKISYKETLTFEGSVNLAGTGLTEDDICTRVEDYVRNDLTLSNTITATTEVFCNSTATGNVVDFNLTVAGADSGTVDLGLILQQFSNFTINATVSCLLSPCLPDATCTDVGFGSRKCSCNLNLYDNDITEPGTNCVNPIHSVYCNKDQIGVELYAAYFTDLGLEAANIHLIDETCTGVVNVSNLVFRNNLGTCGWVTEYDGDQIIYKNNVTNVINSVATHQIAIIFPVSCSYSRQFGTGDNDQTSPSITVLPSTVIITDASGTGELEVTLAVFDNDNFSLALDSNKVMEFGDPLFVELTHSASATDNYLKATDCWTTPSDDPDDTTRHDVITDECPATYASVDIISNGDGQTARFRVSVQPFVDEDKLYVHCNVEVCQSSCQKTCTTKRRRKRNANDGKSNTVSVGPITTQETEDNENVSATSSNTAAITLGCISAVLLIGLTVLVVHRVRKKSNEGEGITMRRFW